MKGYSVRAPSLARTVFAHVPHHITQRGDRHEEIFFSDEDRETYRAWLQDYSRRHDVAILAYRLMSNHIHLPAVPGIGEALQAVLKPLHMRYAQRLKRQRGWKGHVWRGRYFSSPRIRPACGPVFATSSAIRCGHECSGRRRTSVGPVHRRTVIFATTTF